MALPKKRKKDLDVKVRGAQDGPKEYIDQFLDQNKAFLPRGVEHSDLDNGFVEFIDNDIDLTFDGDKTPVLFLTLSRWREFSKTWQNADKYKNLKIPFISIVRKPDAQPGTNPADFKIPVRHTFDYMRIPVWDGNKKGMDLHKIPQPVGVDLTYTVRFFTYKMKQLNKLNKKVLQAFASAQAYINVKGHFFPIMLENVGDESVIDNLNGKRYYVQTYEMKLQGYILDEDEFEVVPALERVITLTELSTKRPKSKVKITGNTLKGDENNRPFECIIQFTNNSPPMVEFIAEEADIYKGNEYVFNSVYTENIDSLVMKVNGNVVTLPFTIRSSDFIMVDIVKTDNTKPAKIILNGLVKN